AVGRNPPTGVSTSSTAGGLVAVVPGGLVTAGVLVAAPGGLVGCGTGVLGGAVGSAGVGVREGMVCPAGEAATGRGRKAMLVSKSAASATTIIQRRLCMFSIPFPFHYSYVTMIVVALSTVASRVTVWPETLVGAGLAETKVVPAGSVTRTVTGRAGAPAWGHRLSWYCCRPSCWLTTTGNS